MQNKYDLIIDNSLKNINFKDFIEDHKNKRNIKIDLDSNEIFNKFRNIIDFFCTNLYINVTFTKELNFFNELPFKSLINCVFEKNINFSNIDINNEFIIRQCKFYKNLFFYDCNFKEAFYLHGLEKQLSEIYWLEFNKCSFKKFCKIVYVNIKNNLEIKDSDIYGLLIRDNIIDNEFYIEYSKIIFTFNFRFNQNKNFILDESKLKGAIFLTDNKIEKLKILYLKKEGDKNTLLKIENSNSKITDIILKNIFNIDVINIFGVDSYNCFDNILIENCEFLDGFKKEYLFKDFIIKNFTIDNVINGSKRLIYQKIIFKNFLIRNTDLGKTTFNGVKIKKLYLKNTTLNDCIFNGVDFKSYELDKGKLSNKQLKDNYRQLKHVMDSNGNYTEANRFYEKEMEYEMLRLGVNKGFFKGLKSLFDNKFLGEETKNLGSKIQLWFGWQFNEFGNNWLRTLFIIILWAFLAVLINIWYNNFIAICIYDNMPHFCLDEKKGILFFGGGGNLKDLFNYDIWKEYFKLFLNLLYPLYGLKKDYIDGLDNWLTLGFIIYKTIYGILFWHLIIALKRTTKR